MSTIVTRAGKGSALTHNEVDANFTNLNTDKVEKSGTDPVVISANSASNALRITQTGTGNALVVEDSANPDSTPFVIDNGGLIIAGATSNQGANLAIGNAKLQILGGTAPLALYREADSSTAINLEFAKKRATGGVLLNNDTIGRLYFSGNDGTAAIPAAYIDAAVDGTPGTNDMPGRLVFSTTADGASTPTERMRIDSSGNIGIGITPTQKLHVSGNILATGSVDCGTQFLGLDTDTATAPSFSFRNDPNTGMYRPGADQVALTVNGNARLTVSTTQFTGTLPWRGQNGTAAAPAFSASADTNTGIYFPAADTIGFTEGGVQVGEFDSSANFKFNSGYGSVATAYGCRAWVNFDGGASGTFAGGVSTVTRISGSTTATVTTTTAHGLITGNVVEALTGVAAGEYVVTFISATQFSFTTVATTALTAASITFAVNNIRASGNVSSVADNGTGDFTVNFTTAMPDANYSCVISPSNSSSSTTMTQIRSSTVPTTSAVRLAAVNTSGAALNPDYINVAVFR